MTEREAIKELQNNVDLPFGSNVSDESSKIAIQAIEKQIPKKPAFNGKNWYRCVNGCEIHKKQFEKDWYCPKCGQKLNWSDEE